MTTIGGIILLATTALFCLWVLDLIRRGRLYVGYGIVILALVGLVVGTAILPFPRRLVSGLMGVLFEREPIAIIGLSAMLVLVVYLLNQHSVLSDRVSTLTQELAIRGGPTRRPPADGE